MSSRLSWRTTGLIGVALVAVVVLWLSWPSRTEFGVDENALSFTPGDVVRGEYLTVAAGCAGCHTNKKNGGAAFAGGRRIETPFGVFYSPNITPDLATGIGSWGAADFLRAVGAGEGRHGEPLYPAFPYPSYAQMRRDDLISIWAYLRSIKPVPNSVPSHELSFPFSVRPLAKVWKTLFFGGWSPLGDDQNKTLQWNRGRYLTIAVAHCGECHTPRNALGAADSSAFLQGTRYGPEGWRVPALVDTPRKGFALWSVEEITHYLKSGEKPDFDSVQGPMAEVIKESTSRLSEEDRAATAQYLKSLND